MADISKKSVISGILQLLIIATALAIAFNIAIMLMPTPFNRYFFGTLQFLWPLLSILLLISIYYSTDDINVRHFSRFFAIALIPWTITILLWEVLLPMFFYNDLAFYVSGFGFLACYVILTYGLFRLCSSKQWFMAPSTSSYINIMAFLAIMALLAFVWLNLKLDSPRLPDVLILLLYLVCDIIILTLCSKLINMNLKPDLKYLVFVMAEFVLINLIGDLLFEARWLISLRHVLSFKIMDVIDPVYFLSLIFVTAALFIYRSRFKEWTLAKIDRDLGGRMLFVEDIVANSPDPMFVCDERGFLILVNGPLLKLFDSERSEVICQFNIFDHLVRKGNEVKAIVDRIKAGETVTADHLQLSREGASLRFISMKIYPLLGPGGKVTNYAGILEDTTEKLRMDEELRDSKRQIELYMDLMGHDINNMNQIGIGYLELAMDKIDNGDVISTDSRFFLEAPLESFRNSSRLIGNIRKIKKVHSHESSMELIDMGNMITKAIQMFSNLQGRDVKIVYKPVAGLLVKADDLLKDVFMNLIGNAIKHSPSERPLTIGITVDRTSEQGRPVYKICVEDDGPGIEDSRKTELFKHSSSNTARAKGLGLYLVRTLIESYDGHIWVEDRIPGDRSRGSRFVIILPAASG
jgi:PAS domain S-box-containing protein